MKGVDFDIDFAIKTAYILYWDSQKNMLKQTTMYAETVYPINIVEAIKVFAPNNAVGANVTFESTIGMSKLLVMTF